MAADASQAEVALLIDVTAANSNAHLIVHVQKMTNMSK